MWISRRMFKIPDTDHMTNTEMMKRFYWSSPKWENASIRPWSESSKIRKVGGTTKRGRPRKSWIGRVRALTVDGWVECGSVREQTCMAKNSRRCPSRGGESTLTWHIQTVYRIAKRTEYSYLDFASWWKKASPNVASVGYLRTTTFNT